MASSSSATLVKLWRLCVCAPVSDVAEEPLDHVRPRCAGRGEMHDEARMPSQPIPHVVMPVRGVVVRDQVKAQMLGRAAVDELQELQPYSVTLARLARRDCAAIQCVERRKQRGGAMPLVVVGDGSGATALHRAIPAFAAACLLRPRNYA